jgi:hypothetical protein
LRLLRSNADATLHTAEFPYSWTELCTLLSVLHKSSPHVPVGVVSGLWGIAVDLAMSVCRCFDNLAFGNTGIRNRVCRLRGSRTQIPYYRPPFGTGVSTSRLPAYILYDLERTYQKSLNVSPFVAYASPERLCQKNPRNWLSGDECGNISTNYILTSFCTVRRRTLRNS